MERTQYPVVFRYSDVVVGNGYVVEVRTKGRALLEECTDGWWESGVNPGGIAAVGDSRAEALSAFREMYRAVLFDIADEASSVDEFRQAAEVFFNQVNDANLTEWEAATEAVTKGAVPTDWLPTVKKEKVAFGLTVDLVKIPSPNINQLERAPELAKAS